MYLTVSDGNLRWAVDNQVSVAFSGPRVSLPVGADNTSISDGKNHVGENHGSIRELLAACHGVHLKGNINPIEISAGGSNSQNGAFSVGS